MTSSTQEVLSALLNDPIAIKSKLQAKQLHAQILKTRGRSPRSRISALLSVYSHFNLLRDSLLLFQTLRSSSSSSSSLPPPPLAWKSIIRCYTSNGFFLQSVACFVEMRASMVYPDHNVFPSVLKSCAMLGDLRLGESVHGSIVRHGLDSDLYTCNALMNMYSKFQSFSGDFGREISGSQMFDEMLERKGVCQNGIFVELVTGVASGELGSGVKMQSFGWNVNNMNETKDIRRVAQMNGVRKVFDSMPNRDAVSWNTVIAGNVQNGMYEEALSMLREMGKAKLKPDSFTLSSVLPMFADYVNVVKGKEIHGYAIRNGFDADVFLGSSLVDMYAKCTRTEDSRRVFDMLPRRDAISWNSIIAGCVQNGMFDEGLRLFQQMLKAKIKPKQVAFSSIMPACSHLTTLHLGKQLHGYIIRSRYDDNVYIASSLVDMYAKCGNIRTARWIFDRIERHDVVSCTAIIMGYALNGYAHDAISLFEQMEREGTKPCYVTFIAVLTKKNKEKRKKKKNVSKKL